MGRAKDAAKRLAEFHIDGLLVSSSADLQYCFGFQVEEGDALALITANDYWFYTDGRYMQEAEEQICDAHVVPLNLGEGYLRRLNNICLAHGVDRLGFNETMPVCDYWDCENQLHAQLIPAAGLLNQMRAVKTGEEIEALRRTQDVVDRSFEAVLSMLRPGVTEKQIATRLYMLLMEQGADGLAFPPMVQSGPHTCLPHKRPTERAIKAGDLVTVDIGCVVDHYCADFARTVAVGSVSEEQQRLCQAVLAAQRAGLDAVKVNAPLPDADYAARLAIEQRGFSARYDHAFGHGIGLEVHEDPVSEPYSEGCFSAGMVMTAEPGIYLPGKFGARTEDTFVLLEGGEKQLFSRIPQEIIVA